MDPILFSDYLLIRPVDKDESAGLATVETNKGRPAFGIAVLVGPGKFTEMGVRLPIEVQPGDLVSFPSYAGDEIRNPRGVPPGDYLMMRAETLYMNHGPEPEEIHE